LAQWVSGTALVLFALSWAAIAGAPRPLVLLTVGVVVLDLAGQALHVTNQHLIVDIDPTASSRLIGSYTVYYSIGTGAGAIGGTVFADYYGVLFRAPSLIEQATDGGPLEAGVLLVPAAACSVRAGRLDGWAAP
jgi:predicted MFS family arabinose efflux permease